jgi:hypothetical protein
MTVEYITVSAWDMRALRVYEDAFGTVLCPPCRTRWFAVFRDAHGPAQPGGECAWCFHPKGHTT